MRLSTRTTLFAAVLAFGAASASADVIFDTGLPGGFFGYIGYDVSSTQSVGVAFTPSANYTLDDVGVWFMSNDFDNPGRTFTLSLRNSVPGSNNGVPGPITYETWNMAATAIGWDPMLETATSSLHPLLVAGTQYWLVAESNEIGGLDPVWVWGDSPDPVVSGNDDFFNPGWQSGVTQGSAPGTIIHASPVPEPATICLLTLAGMAVSRRRR